MPQMSPSWWFLISMYELFMFYILISKLYFFSIYLKISPLKKKNIQKQFFYWKW